MVQRKTLLNKILRSLVEEWGAEDVQAELKYLIGVGGVDYPSAKKALKRSSGHIPSRPNARQQVERALISDEKKEILFVLAERFDKKQFLPSVADVREFLIFTGEHPSNMKDRTDAFRALLRRLVEFSDDRIRVLLSDSMHNGPSQLGPISDAIAAAAERLPRNINPLGKSEELKGATAVSETDI